MQFTTYALSWSPKKRSRRGMGSPSTPKKARRSVSLLLRRRASWRPGRALDWQEHHAQLQYGDGGNLRLVDSYKHLGTLMTNICAESQRWFDVRKQRARSLRPSPSACCATRSSLCRSDDRAALACVDGVLFSAAGWWSALSQRELLLLNTPRSRLLRAPASVKTGPGGPTDAELRTQIKVPSTSLVMQAARLRYLPRLLRHGPPSPRSLLRLPSASQWRQTMVTDLSDKSKVLSSKLGMLPDPTLDTAHQFLRPWRSLVKLYMSKRAEDATALDPSDVRRELIDGEDTEYRCDECSRAFTTYGGLTAHQAHQHGRVDWTRRYAGGTSCPVCYGEYWTRLRVRLHLKASQRCQAMIAIGGAPELSDEEVRRLDAQDVAQRRDNVAAARYLHYAAQPALPGFLATHSWTFYDGLLSSLQWRCFFRFCQRPRFSDGAAVCMMAHCATHLNEAFPLDSVS